MKVLPRILYLACFTGLGIVAAVSLNRATDPSMAPELLRAVFLAAFCAAPGLVYRKLWPLAVVLVPLGLYLLLRTVTPLPSEVGGLGGQLSFYAHQLARGASAYEETVFPLPVDQFRELQPLLAFSLYCLLGVAGFIALSLRRPVPAVALILVVVGYGLTVDLTTRALWLALLFVVLSVCLLVLCRGLAREGWRARDMMAGGAVGVVGSVLAFTLLAAAPSTAADPWQDWRTWDPFGHGRSVYTFNWLQNYPRLLDPNKNVVIMRVESPLPSYWRANALDTFNGQAWATSQAFLMSIDSTGEAGGGYSFALPTTELVPQGDLVSEVFHLQSVYTNYFFVGGDPRSLSSGQNIALRMNDMRSLRVSEALGPTLDYSVTAVIPKLKPLDLVGLGTDYPEELDRYLLLPFSRADEVDGADKDVTWRSMMSADTRDGWEWTDLYSLNSRIIGDATDPYEITLRIERHLRQYVYSLAPPASDFSSPYAAFLFDTHTGYCQHFAGAMALLLRYNGIPSRVANGFTAGEVDRSGAYIVSTNNAHAWVEAYFPEVGWVAFDPTPGRSIPTAGASSTTPGFINPFPSGSAAEPDTPDAVTPRTTIPLDVQTEDGTTAPQREGWLSRASWLPWVAALVAVLAGWPLVRHLWRSRRLHRGSPGQRLQASLELLRADMSDGGLPVTSAHTLDEALRILQARTGLEPDLGLLDRTDAVLFGGREATTEDFRRAETLRGQVKTRLKRRRGWVRTLFAWYGVRRLSLGARAA